MVITFHSLEDKIVKEKFKDFRNPCRNYEFNNHCKGLVKY